MAQSPSHGLTTEEQVDPYGRSRRRVKATLFSDVQLLVLKPHRRLWQSWFWVDTVYLGTIIYLLVRPNVQPGHSINPRAKKPEAGAPASPTTFP